MNENNQKKNYELKLIRRNIPIDELLDDLKIVSKKLGQNYFSMDTYEKHGQFSRGVFKAKFGSWNKALEKAGLEIINRRNIPEDELLDDLKTVSKKIGQNSFSMETYEKHGQFSRAVFKIKFGSWNKALEKAGLLIFKKYNIPDDDFFNNIALVWEKLGRQPRQYDFDSDNISSISSGPYKKRFGTYNNALKLFVKWINKGNGVSVPIAKNNNDLPLNQKQLNQKQKTKREINLRLRFLVLSRDNFKCKICGRSPATEINTKLEVDHIKSWSKGGETVIDNLQTLCSKCNGGKSNL